MNAPYYVLGLQNQPGASATTEDVVLLKLNADGVFQWKKKYDSQGDDEFFRDLEALPNGDLLIAGNAGNGGPGLIYIVDNAGVQYSGVDITSVFFTEMTRGLSGDIYAVANTTTAQAHLMKFNQDMLLLWDVIIPELISVGQVFEGLSGEIYMIGRGSFEGVNRHVIIRLTDSGALPTEVDWVRYLNSGSGFNNGFAWRMPESGQIAFTDTRIVPVSFGQNCAFISVSDKELTACNVSDGSVSLIPVEQFPNGPVGPGLDFQDVLPAVSLESSLVNWLEAEVCSSNPPCTADFSFQVNCGFVVFSDQSTVPGTATWSWSFPGGTPSSSNAQNPTTIYPACGTYQVCLIVTGATPTSSCSDTVCHTVTIADTTPPNVICQGEKEVGLDANCSVTLDPAFHIAGFSDNCQVVAQGISPNILTQCGTYPVIVTVTDWCGNMDSCFTTVKVIDQTSPVITCPPSLTVTATTPPPCAMQVDGIQWFTLTDNCPAHVDYVVTGATNNFGQNDASGLVYNQGNSIVTYTATDDCGNTGTCSFVVTVVCEQASIFNCGMAVVTCFSNFQPGTNNTLADANGPVLALVDLRNHATAPLGTEWQAGLSHLPAWNSQNMGQIFGVTIDNNYNVYASSTTMYGKYMPTTPPVGGFGNVYKIDAINGAVTTFATLPQDPNPSNASGLGDVWYDKVSNQIFVSNFNDGRIYYFDPLTPQVPIGSYKFPSTALGTPSPGFIARGERVWAVATHNNRLYFSVWNEDKTRIEPGSNEIWSVALVGGIPSLGTELLERVIPNYLALGYSSPVSDISFSESGIMLVAERTMDFDYGNAAFQAVNQAHEARIFEFSGANWVNAKIFYSGNANVNNNSAGGIDYGYESFDPLISPVPLLCDSIIWSTGDALRFPGFNTIPDGSTLPCGGSTGDYIYGLTGIPQTGNSNLPIPASTYVKNSSIYIDIDHNICSNVKIRIGDVDVFKNCIVCPTVGTIPCDSLMVMLVPDPPGNQCCFYVDIKNNFGPSISKLEIDLCTPGVIFNTIQANTVAGFQYTGSGGQTISITHNSGSIPAGISNGVIRFCYSGSSGAGTFPQTLKFTWFQNVGGIDLPTDCRDTTHTDCVLPPPVEDSCIAVTPLSVECDSTNVYQYILNFKVTNLSSLPSFNAYNVDLYGLTPGFTFSPCVGPTASLTSISIPIPGAPLLPTQMSGNMCVKIISSTPILSPQTICAQARLIGIEECCTVIDTFCFTIEPCCDPCESIAITVTPTNQAESDCCYSLGIINNCPYPFFTKIEAEITSGATYGYQALNPALINFWTIAPSTNTKLCIRPINGTIPGGTITDLVSFCLSNISSPTQTIVIRWITIGSNGLDSIACDTTLIFECEVDDYPCLIIEDLSIECQPDSNKYLLTFTVTNNSPIPFCATSLDFIQLAPSDLIFSPSASFVFSPPLCQNFSQAVSICLFDTDGLPGSGNLIFIPKLSFQDGDTCCYEGIPVNIPLPPCMDSCVCAADLTISQIGIDYPVSCFPHTGSTPSLACPADDVIVSGFFGCENPVTGEPCAASNVNWVLAGPNNQIISSGISNNNPALIFQAALVSAPGSYSVTFSTICPGTMDTCICVASWVREPCDTCCLSLDDFCDRIDNAVSVIIDGSLCKATLNIGDFGGCDDHLEWVSWGEVPNQQEQGPFTTGNMPMHQYAGGGTYIICYLAIELDANGLICLEKIVCDTINIVCDTCCTDSIAFTQAVENATNVIVDNAQCKAILNIGDLPCDGYINLIDWGQGSIDIGNYGSGTMPMHTYNGSGTYFLVWNAIALDANGDSCLQLTLQDTIVLTCPIENDTCYIPPIGMVGWWPMDDQSGDLSVIDISGGLHHGTPLQGGMVDSPGPVPVSGKVGGALHFEGQLNTYVEVSDHPDLNFGGGSFSIDAWINTEGLFGTQHIVTKLHPLNIGYSLTVESQATPYYLNLEIGDGTSIQSYQGPSITLNDWNFVAVTVSPQMVTFYVGNASSGSMTQTNVAINSPYIASNGLPLRIGYHPQSPDWNIKIDELEIFDRALDPTEVNAIWNADSLGKCKPCDCAYLNTDVTAGYAVSAMDSVTYQFQPLGELYDCDIVTWEWDDGSDNTFSIGTSPVLHVYFDTVPIPHDVCMNVKRLDPDGDTCEISNCLIFTSIENLEKPSAIRLFPNPTTGELTLQFTGEAPKKGSVQLLDIYGRTHLTEILLPGSREYRLSISTLPAGVYFVRVFEEGVPVWVEKIMKH